MKQTVRKQGGNALIIALIAVIVLAGSSAALFSVTSTRNAEARFGRNYTRTLYVAEAGISASIAEITAAYDYDGDGLGVVAGSVDGGTYSTTAVNQGDEVWHIRSAGNYNELSRGIEIIARRRVEQPFTHGAFGGTGLTMGGQGFVDSYDTRDGSYGDQALNVDPVSGETYASTDGDIGSNGNIDASGQVTIFGDATPGPDGSVTEGPNTVIHGSTTPALEDEELDLYEYDPPIASMGVLSLTNPATLSAGVYRYDYMLLSSKANLTLGENSGDVLEIYIDGVISITGQAQLTVADGASVTILHGGLDLGRVAEEDPDINFAGQGVVNTGEIPADLIIISASTGLINLAGQSDFHGVIYAPAATINFSGQADVFGSLTGNSISITGQGDLHYDEALEDLNIGGFFRYRIRSWREFRP